MTSTRNDREAKEAAAVAKAALDLSETYDWRDQVAREMTQSRNEIAEIKASVGSVIKSVSNNTDICAEMKKNTDDMKKNTDEMKKDTQEIVDFFKGMKMLKGLATWITAISAAAAAAVYALKGGGK